MRAAFIEPLAGAGGINPYGPIGSFPLGILSNATTAKKLRQYWDVRCFDEHSRRVMRGGEIVEPYLLRADFVGISTKTATAPRTYAIADALRNARIRGEANSRLRVVIGGIHATALPDEALQHSDCVVTGEAEDAIIPVIEERREGIVKGEKIKNLDDLADPDYSLLSYRGGLVDNFLNLIRHRTNKKWTVSEAIYGPLASVSSMRGCSYACDFCSVWGMFGKARYESPEKTFKKLENLRNKGFKRIFFHNDNFSDNKEYTTALFNLIERGKLGIRYLTQDRIDLLQEGDYVERMGRSGCDFVMFSVESPNPEFLNEHNKSLEIEKIEAGVRLLKRNKIIPYAFCMVEPENPEAAKRTLELLRGVGVEYAQFHIPMPLPGTPLYHRFKEQINSGWEHFHGMTMVTGSAGKSKEEHEEEMRRAGRHLSETWKEFYSPSRIISRNCMRIFYSPKKAIEDVVFMLCGLSAGEKIFRLRPRI